MSEPQFVLCLSEWLTDGAARFHPAPTPSIADVAAVVKRVAERMRWWRRRHRVSVRPTKP